MRLYTQSELNELISCRKTVIDPPKREMKLEGSQRRNDMRLRADDANREFSVFMRMHDEFNENFSIGLKHDPRDGSGELILLRCNGPHGEYNGRFDARHPHTEYHVHRASEAAIKEGLRPESRAERTKEFASYREALIFFLSETNVVDAASHFSEMRQPSLPFEAEDQTS